MRLRRSDSANPQDARYRGPAGPAHQLMPGGGYATRTSAFDCPGYWRAAEPALATAGEHEHRALRPRRAPGRATKNVGSSIGLLAGLADYVDDAGKKS
jgi:hypothetical protein